VIAIDSTKDAAADRELLAEYALYKDSMEFETSVVIGRAAKTLTMDRKTHENPLANFISDALREYAQSLLNPKAPPSPPKGGDVPDGCRDAARHVSTCASSSPPLEGLGEAFALVNFGGIRASLPVGEITVGEMMSILPFDNKVVILSLKGADVRALANICAASGGQGVSGMTFGIKDKKAVNVLINGKEIDDNRDYIIATIDFLAMGGDGMTPLLRAQHLYTPAINMGGNVIKEHTTLLDLMINVIKSASARGEMIDADLDGRVYLVEN
jgi:2',3'-cyclic-nucleotide 2'-phosphodiesterase (5'-nucleotidase family)